MVSLEVELEDSQLRQLISAIEMNEASGFFENTQRAIGQAAQTTQRLWQSWAMGNVSVRGIMNRRPSGKLAQSIGLKKTGLMTYRVSTNDPDMERIQNGRPEIDMKDLNSPWMKSRKTRVSYRKGVMHPYLIIPFSWRTNGNSEAKNVVPIRIVNILRKRDVSFITHQAENNWRKVEPNRYGEMIPRASYQWGGRISKEESVLEDGKDSGMVRMWDSAFNNKTVGKYFTFRVLSVNSRKDSWIQPAIPAVDIVGAIVQEMQPEVEKTIRDAVAQDLDL